MLQIVALLAAFVAVAIGVGLIALGVDLMDRSTCAGLPRRRRGITVKR